MKIKLKDVIHYTSVYEVPRGTNINGMVLVVNAGLLYPDRFRTRRTLTFPSILVDARDVAVVIDDARIGKSKCLQCGRIWNTGESCIACRDSIMEELVPGSKEIDQYSIGSMLDRCFPGNKEVIV